MEALIAFLSGLLANQTVLQIFVGGSTMLLIGWMVTRARVDKEALPAPAAGSIADVPPVPFLQGPREVIDIIREQRDMDRRRTEDSERIRECVRIIREESKKQTELLQQIVNDGRVEAALAAERSRNHP